jgi:hypothetical protein
VYDLVESSIEIKNDWNRKGKMIVIRMFLSMRDGDEIRRGVQTAHEFGDELRDLRKEYKLDRKFAVIVDVSGEAADEEYVDVKKNNKKKEKNTRNVILKNKKQLIAADFDNLAFESYEELDDLPCILILVKKGKMGCTFPNNFSYFDIRMSYYSGKIMFQTPLIQDVYMPRQKSSCHLGQPGCS